MEDTHDTQDTHDTIGEQDTHAAQLHYPAAEDLCLVTILQALSDPVRLQIVRILDDAGRDVGCFEMGLPVAKSTASHHYKVLREAGLVTARYDGTRKYFTLRRDDVDARFPGLLDSVLRAAEHADLGV